MNLRFKMFRITVTGLLLGAIVLSRYVNGDDEEKVIDKSAKLNNNKTLAPTTTASGNANKQITPSSEQIPQTSSKPKTTVGTNSTCNGTACEQDRSNLDKFFKAVKENKGMLLRTLYVLMGVTSIVIIYFVVRAWRLRRRSKSKKYGLITSRGTDMEMEPLDADDDDDDDDMTVFDMNNRRKK